MKSVALTDHGNMFGAVEFYLKASDAGIKPVVGYEAYVAPGGRRERRAHGIAEASYHLTLLAMNSAGYRNLMKLSTAAFLEGYYYKPRIDKELLAEHSEGLVALSGCLSGEIARHILAEDPDAARETAGAYSDIFDDGNFYLELQANPQNAQKLVNAGLVELGSQTGLPLVATNDVHYLTREDARAHDFLLCIGTGKTIDDPNRMRFDSDEYYFKTGDEMAAAFRELPQAIRSTTEIAERSHLSIQTGTYHLPRFSVPEGETLESHLRKLCEAGLAERYGDATPELSERLSHELDVIGRMDFPGYMLIVGDIVRQAREMGIPVGPGRGSATGSLVCYCLGITDLDPIKYDLIFERFINEGRNEMPDIDLDFCQERRGEIIDYVTQKYGQSNVAQIITFSTMAAKGSIRDVGRVMNVPYVEVDGIAKLVPMKPGITLDEAIQSEPELRRRYESDETAREIIDIARRIEGLVRQPGTHAAGVVVSDRPLTEYCPLYRASGSDEVTTQYPMKMVDAIGLLKVDFLGLQTLTIIEKAVRLIRQRRDAAFRIEDVPLDDPKVYRMLARGDSKAVFQFESSGMREMLRQARPDQIEDLTALNAMYRPGPIDQIPVFCRRKNGSEPISYLHPKLEPFLKSTYGVICYQEQVIHIAHELAGFSLSEADSLRKAMGKKIRELMEEYRPKFLDGVTASGLAGPQAEQLWDEIVTFSGYGFNKSHSAAYALVAYRTAYLKCNFPEEFTAALLTCEMGNTDKVDEYRKEAERMGVTVLPPDVNRSGVDFLIQEPEGAAEGEAGEDARVRYGLAAVKGVGVKSVEAIVAARDAGGPFRDIFEFCERVDLHAVNKTVVENLIKCGAFDPLGKHRSQWYEVMEEAIAVGQSVQRDRARGQASIFEMMETGSEAGASELPEMPEWPEHVLLEKEKEALGFYMSSHPLARHSRFVRQYSTTSTARLANTPADTEVLIGGLVASVQKKRTRRGDFMAVLQFEDLDSTVEAVVFPRVYEDLRGQIASDRVVFVRGRVDQTGDEASIKVTEIIPIEEAREQLTSRVVLRIESTDATPELLDDIVTIFRANPGQTRAYFEVETPSGERVLIKSAAEHSVSANERLFGELESLLGEGSVLCAADPNGPSRRAAQERSADKPLAF